MSRTFRNAPHACIKADFPSPLIAREEISGIFENHLRTRYGAARRGLLWQWNLRLPRMLDVQVEGKSVLVVWHTNRFNKGEWIITMAPGDSQTLWDRLRGRKPVDYTKELTLACRDIHALLTSVKGISNIKWYFDDFRRQGRNAVWTPDELPWAET
jgi:hypothetical protein